MPAKPESACQEADCVRDGEIECRLCRRNYCALHSRHPSHTRPA